MRFDPTKLLRCTHTYIEYQQKRSKNDRIYYWHCLAAASSIRHSRHIGHGTDAAMSSILPRRVDFDRGASPRRLSGATSREEDSHSTSPAQTSSDAVLLRCRDTIERLHGDVEEERQKRQRMQEQLEESDSDSV